MSITFPHSAQVMDVLLVHYQPSSSGTVQVLTKLLHEALKLGNELTILYMYNENQLEEEDQPSY